MIETKRMIDGHDMMGVGNLDNLTAGMTDMSEGDDMSKRIKMRVEIDGVTKWATGGTQQEVILAAAKMLIESGAFSTQPAVKKQAPLFGECAWSWYDVFKQPNVRDSTADFYLHYLRKHVLPAFGARRIDEIRPTDIQAFLNSKRSYARSTVHHIWIILHGIFSMAKWDKYIDEDPTEDAKRYSMSKNKTARKAMRAEDIDEIISQLPKLKRQDQALLAILIYTGMRRGEMLGLRWEDIDFTEGMIYVQRSVRFKSNRPVVGETKSEAGNRGIPLLPELREILEPLRQINGYVIGQDEPLTETAYRRTWERIGKKIDLHGATAHIFRHTFVTRASYVIQPKALQAIAGHADIETTMDIYAGRDKDKIKAAGQALKGMYM